MRCRAFAVVVLSVAAGLWGAADSQFFQLEQANKNGTVQIIGKNISGSPIVAYVVVAEHAQKRMVWNGVYTRGDSLGVGKSVTLGEITVGSSAEQAKVYVDYVRLADGTAWGDAKTDQAKEIEARFQK